MDIEAEIKRQLTILRNLQNYLAESSANHKDFMKILEIFQNPLHRILKLNCYPLLKTFPPSELALLELEKDFSNQDLEIQLCSLKLAYSLPLQKQIQIVKQYDTAIYAIIEGSSSFHYERLLAVNSILQLLMTRETEVDPIDMPKQAIINIYKRIAENCFNNNRDISANCILCLGNCLQEISQNPNNLIVNQVNLPQVSEYLLPRLQLLLDRVFSFELRIRSKMLVIFNYLLQGQLISIKAYKTVNPLNPADSYLINLEEFNALLVNRITQEMLKSNYEVESLVQIYQCLFEFFKLNKFPKLYELNYIIWVTFEHLNEFIKTLNYKKEFNPLLVQYLLFDLDCNSKIAISMRVLEISSLVQSSLTRYVLMLYAFDNLVNTSLQLVQQRKNSAILGLYNQAWFLNKVKDDPEELIICIITAVVHNDRKNAQILQEILDICNSCIWESCNIEVLLIYLILIDECSNLIPANELQLADVIGRINTNQMSFVQKVHTLRMLTQKFNQSTLNGKLDYTTIISDFRSFMIQPISTPIYKISLLQNIYVTLYQLANGFHTQENFLKQQILELLSDYNDNLLQRKNEHTADIILEFNKYIINAIQQNELITSDQLLIKVDKDDDAIHQNHHIQLLQLAYNIYIHRLIPIERDSQIANLQIQNTLANNIFTNLELQSQLITGVSDFVQIYCQHVIDLSTSSICLGISVINICPFKIENLGIKILLDKHAVLQDNMKIIDELPSYQEKQLFFVVKAKPQQSMHFAFELFLNSGSENSQYRLRTQNYRISLIEFLIPNEFLYLSQKCFEYVSFEQSFHIACNLECGYLLLLKTLAKSPFAVAILNQNNAVFNCSVKQNLEQIAMHVTQTIKIALLAYLSNGNTIAITISDIPTTVEKSIVTAQIQSNYNCIESFRKETNKLIAELSGGLLQNIY